MPGMEKGDRPRFIHGLEGALSLTGNGKRALYPINLTRMTMCIAPHRPPDNCNPHILGT